MKNTKIIFSFFLLIVLILNIDTLACSKYPKYSTEVIESICSIPCKCSNCDCSLDKKTKSFQPNDIIIKFLTFDPFFKYSFKILLPFAINIVDKNYCLLSFYREWILKVRKNC